MSAAHTPGQWLIADGDEKTFVYALNAQGYNRFSAHVQRGHSAPMQPTELAELEANARLIAAAPELLAALERIANETAATWVCDVAHAAIAKATGAAA